jgi:hypothetical protein
VQNFDQQVGKQKQEQRAGIINEVRSDVPNIGTR